MAGAGGWVTTQAVAQLLQRLHNELGFEAERIGVATVTRALQGRLEALGLQDADYYPTLVWQRAEEWRAFIDAVVVPESWFMRGPESFTLVQRLARRRTWSLPLRCLSLACAGGEEPYSLALALAGAGLLPSQASIDAVDISARNLAHTRQGRYGEFALRAVDAAFKERHFRHTPEGYYQLHPEWLGWLRLHLGNIVDDAWQPANAPYHVIFCRNVMIYFTAAMQRHLMRRLSQWLAPNGVLIVGHAEGSLARQFFQARGESRALAFGPQSASGLQPAALPPPHPPGLLAVPVTPPSFVPLAMLSPPLVPMSPVLPTVPEQVPPLPDLAMARRLADQGDWAAATAQCLAWLQTPALDLTQQAEAYFLLGLVAFAQRQFSQAETQWRKVMYLVPEHALALRYLSLLEQQGYAGQSQRWQTRWQQVSGQV